MFSRLYLAVATALPAGAQQTINVKPGATPHVTMTLSPQVLQQLLNSQQYHQTWLSSHLGWLTHSVAGLFMASAASLVILLACQTTKQEGLSGTIGGRVEAAYRPRLGFDQQLTRITGFVAISFVVFATIISLTGI
jgi:protein translocase SecG subunit